MLRKDQNNQQEPRGKQGNMGEDIGQTGRHRRVGICTRYWADFYILYKCSPKIEKAQQFRKPMSESVYKPKQCAFHPKEIIFNFCRNQDCLLPLCPTCVDVHSEEHRQEKTYGKFENIHQVVNDLTFTMETNIKQLDNFSDEIKDQLAEKKLDEQALRRQVMEAKERVLGLVERFFTDFEESINKSILEFNVSMRDTYRDMQTTISSTKLDLSSKIQSLGTQKVLKTIIGYHSKQEQKRTQTILSQLRCSLDETANKRAGLLMDHNSIHKMVGELSQYMCLSFENWEQDVKYVAEFVKTGFTTGSGSGSASGGDEGV